MRIKLEVAASGTSTVSWPEGVVGVNDLFKEFSDESSYEGLVTANATETTAIVYSNSGDPALPITLADLTARYENGHVEINWTTESETQNLGFVIKRAVQYGEDDLSDYEVIASYLTHDALFGAGNSTGANHYAYTDRDVKPGVTYRYILEDVDYNGTVTAQEPVTVIVPENTVFANSDFSLGSGYPNPFNPSFTVPFELNRAMDVNIAMYDITGKMVRSIASGSMDAGNYRLHVDASDLNSGIYFVRTVIGKQVLTQKMLLVK